MTFDTWWRQLLEQGAHDNAVDEEIARTAWDAAQEAITREMDGVAKERDFLVSQSANNVSSKMKLEGQLLEARREIDAASLVLSDAEIPTHYPDGEQRPLAARISELRAKLEARADVAVRDANDLRKEIDKLCGRIAAMEQEVCSRVQLRMVCIALRDQLKQDSDRMHGSTHARVLSRLVLMADSALAKDEGQA